MTLQEVKSETEKDISLQAFIKAIESDWWSDPKVQESEGQAVGLQGNSSEGKQDRSP